MDANAAWMFLLKIRDNDRGGHGTKFKAKMTEINQATCPDMQVRPGRDRKQLVIDVQLAVSLIATVLDLFVACAVPEMTAKFLAVIVVHALVLLVAAGDPGKPSLIDACWCRDRQMATISPSATPCLQKLNIIGHITGRWVAASLPFCSTSALLAGGKMVVRCVNVVLCVSACLDCGLCVALDVGWNQTHVFDGGPLHADDIVIVVIWLG